MPTIRRRPRAWPPRPPVAFYGRECRYYSSWWSFIASPHLMALESHDYFPCGRCAVLFEGGDLRVDIECCKMPIAAITDAAAEPARRSGGTGAGQPRHGRSVGCLGTAARSPSALRQEQCRSHWAIGHSRYDRQHVTTRAWNDCRGSDWTEYPDE